MADNSSSDILVHYKGRYYCFDAEGGSLSNATEQQGRVAHEAVASGALLANLGSARNDIGDGCLCYVVDADALGAVPMHDESSDFGQIIAFQAERVQAFDVESLEPRGLPHAVAKSVARSFDRGLVVGCMVQNDVSIGTNCTLINAHLASAPVAKPLLEHQASNTHVLHYRGRYYSIDTEGRHSAPTSGALLDAAKVAVESGAKVASLRGEAAHGASCTVVDLSAIAQDETLTEPSAVLHHHDGRTQVINLLNGRMHSASEELHARADEALAVGTWLARIPQTSDLAGLSCYVLDLGALRQRQRR